MPDQSGRRCRLIETFGTTTPDLLALHDWLGGSGGHARGRKAIVAVGHEILVAAWRVLSSGQPYEDPGPDALRNLSSEHVKRRALAQLRTLGYDITIHEPAA